MLQHDNIITNLTYFLVFCCTYKPSNVATNIHNLKLCSFIHSRQEKQLTGILKTPQISSKRLIAQITKLNVEKTATKQATERHSQ